MLLTVFIRQKYLYQELKVESENMHYYVHFCPVESVKAIFGKIWQI